MSNNSLDDAEIHRKIIIRLNHLLKRGVRAHTKKDCSFVGNEGRDKDVSLGRIRYCDRTKVRTILSRERSVSFCRCLL